MNTEEQIKCKPIKVITDARVIMDLPTTSYYGRRPYDKEKINSEGKDLISAINDHISLKDYKPYIDIVEEGNILYRMGYQAAGIQRIIKALTINQDMTRDLIKINASVSAFPNP